MDLVAALYLRADEAVTGTIERIACLWYGILKVCNRNQTSVGKRRSYNMEVPRNVLIRG